jgi:3-oxoadipate enol-lactonase
MPAADRLVKKQTMQIVETNGIRLNYVVQGEGDWLLLIGGYASGNWQAWGRQIDILSRSFRVLAFDNRGIGGSDVPNHPYDTRSMAADAAGLMDHLGITRAHVLGKSLGGAIAQWLAIDRPELVRRLAMTSTLARPHKRFQHMVGWWMATAEKAGFEHLFPGLLTYFYSEAFYETHFEQVQKAEQALIATPRSLQGFLNTGHAAMEHDSWDRLPDIRCPTFLLCGGDDVITTAAHTQEIAARIPHAEALIVPGTLHGFMSERPDSLDRIIEFFQRQQQG